MTSHPVNARTTRPVSVNRSPRSQGAYWMNERRIAARPITAMRAVDRRLQSIAAVDGISPST